MKSGRLRLKKLGPDTRLTLGSLVQGYSLIFLRVEISIFNSDPRQVLQGVKLVLLIGVEKGTFLPNISRKLLPKLSTIYVACSKCSPILVKMKLQVTAKLGFNLSSLG